MNILDFLTKKQRIQMCFWGPTRRYKYLDYLHMGMHQQAAFRNAKEYKKEKK